MQSEHVNKKVQTRKGEYYAKLYYSQNLKRQYESELARRNPNTTFHSTDAITNHLAADYTVNQLPSIKTNTNQAPGSQNETSQTPHNK